MNAVSREEIEQVEKELDAVLEMVQRPVTVKNADNREEAASLQENLQESSQEKSQKNLQERSQESELVQIEIKKEKKKAGSLGKAKEQTAAAREEKVDAVHKVSADEREDVQAPEELKEQGYQLKAIRMIVHNMSPDAQAPPRNPPVYCPYVFGHCHPV